MQQLFNDLNYKSDIVGVFSYFLFRKAIIDHSAVTTVSTEEHSPDQHSLWSIIDFEEKIGN